MGINTLLERNTRLISACIIALLVIRIIADFLSYFNVLPPVNFGTSYNIMLFFGIVFLSRKRFFKERLISKHARKTMILSFFILLATMIILSSFNRLNPRFDPIYLNIPIDLMYITGLIFFLLDARENAHSHNN